MFRYHRLIAVACSLSALALCPLGQAVGQDLFVTEDRTIGGGNPLSGGVDGFVVVGADMDFNPFPNVTVDITGGTITDYVSALNQSVVNISGGVIGKLSDGGQSFTALSIGGGSTINLSGGTINSFVTVGPLFGDDGTINTFNMSGGTTPYIYNNAGGVVNITGGTIAAAPGFIQGVVGNYDNGTINITGGTMDIVGGFGFNPGTINFGGTAATDRLNVFSGVANVTGGTIGAGGVTIQNTGVVNFTGAGLTVNSSGTHAFFDENYFQNFLVADYTITGTLTSGAALNTTVSAGGDYSNDGALATFNAPALAPDLFVTTDQSVSGVYNNVNVGIDETFSTPSNPTATIADGTDTVFLTTYSNSVTNMTGGIVRGFVYVSEQSQFNMTGGEAPGGIANDIGTTVNISGGHTAYLGIGGAATVSGGTIDFVEMVSGGSLTVQGSGLSATGTAAKYWDGYTNYLNAGQFNVTGTLTDGNAFDQTVLASGASGDATQQTLVGPQAAPNLFLTEDTTTDAIYNQVTVGRSADSAINTSPTVTVGAGSDLGQVFVSNQSTLNVKDGVIRGTISSGKDTRINISGGTLASVYQSSTGSGKITVSGGSTTYIAPRNAMEVTGGDIGTLDTYAGAQVHIEGGNITNMLLFGSPSAVTNVIISGGAVGTIDYRTTGVVTTLLGGSVGEIKGGGGIANIYGGEIGQNALLNFRSNATLFNLVGFGLTVSDGTAGTYTDTFNNTFNGVWWQLAGILQNGDHLNTSYFERGGSLNGPTNLTVNVSLNAPEPGTLAFVVGAIPIAGLLLRRPRNRS
jgi:autotransporter family porin